MNMNSGYSGWSMSKNAVLAYEDGEKPKSKWTKTAMLEAIEAYCFDNDLYFDPATKKLTKAQIWDKYMEWSSWHHTSKFANETDFYSISEDAIEDDFSPMTEEQLAEKEALIARRIKEREEMIARVEARNKAIQDYEKQHGFRPDSASAFAMVHPELVEYRTSKRGNKIMMFDWHGRHYECLDRDAYISRVVWFSAIEEGE